MKQSIFRITENKTIAPGVMLMKLEGDTSAINRFRGEYMEQYSWAAQYKTKFTD